jgi:NADH dehydrogenase
MGGQTPSSSGETVVITGSLSYTGRYVTKLLLGRGYEVRTLTHHPLRDNPFGRGLQVLPYNFDHPRRLARSLTGAPTLINTYWVRFPRGPTTFAAAVQNIGILISAAKEAGVRRIVHVSIANAALQSPLGYYKGKAQAEEMVIKSGLSFAILRPTVIFGSEDILINNIAWFVRRFPVFGIPGDGQYRIRPIYVEDMARLLADAVEQKANTLVDAVGPETFSFQELVKLIAAQVGSSARPLHLPMPLAYVSTLVAGWFLRDVVLTWEEYKGLMGNLLAPEGPPSGATLLSQWLRENREHVGTHYSSELARHYTSAPG